MLVQKWGDMSAQLKNPCNPSITKCRDVPKRREKRRCHFGTCTRLKTKILQVERGQHLIHRQSKRDVTSSQFITGLFLDTAVLG